jgi:plastocyanin
MAPATTAIVRRICVSLSTVDAHGTIELLSMKINRLLVIPFAVALSACGGSDNGAPAPTAAATAPAPVTSSEVSGTVPANAIVTLIPAAAAPPLPEGPAVMDQYSKRFVPDVLYVRVGQPVEFRNSEDMPHNVIVKRRTTGSEVFNVGTEPQQKYVHTFDRVAQYDVLCDIHPGMQATVIATESPLATIADDAGRFAIADVPLGSYKLSLVFQGRTVEQAVDVKGARTEVKAP